MKQTGKPETDNGKTQLSVAKIGLISALGVAIVGMVASVLSAYFSSQAAQAPILIPIQATQTAEARLTLPTAAPDRAAPGSVKDVERELTAANITLSTGTIDDVARVRGYVSESDSAYHLLALSTIRVMAGRRFKQTLYLDLIDKWYTALVGEAQYVTADGSLNVEPLKEAMLKAHNDYYGDDAGSFDEIVGPRP